MEPQAIFPILIVLLVAVIGIFAYLQAMKRRKELREWAESRGYRFTPDADRSFDSQFSEFHAFRRGHSRRAYNIIWGEEDHCWLCVFDYQFTVGSGKNQHTHYFTGVMYDPKLPLKPLHIRPENFFDKLTEFAGFDDIDFESIEFSKEFYVTSPDKKWAYDVLHQGAIEFLMNSPRYTIDMQPRRILVMNDRTWSIAEIETGLALVEGLVKLFPAYLIEELKGAAV
ncbi:MAG: hypothetical protein GC154_06530 [bacterium]|nr:hypothetical protein [bacterium]